MQDHLLVSMPVSALQSPWMPSICKLAQSLRSVDLSLYIDCLQQIVISEMMSHLTVSKKHWGVHSA